MKSKSLLSKYKCFYEYGKSFSTVNPHISYSIWNYGVTSIFDEYKKNNSLLNESEKQQFQQMVQELATLKKSMTDFKDATQEEYLEFMENLFANVDDEDRNGEVTMKTSMTFKMTGELVDVLAKWAEIPKEWQQRSNFLFNLEKYCKFKAVDIFKSLKQGIEPKRGGPKEEESDINKELNNLIIEDQKESDAKQAKENNSNQHNNNPKHIDEFIHNDTLKDIDTKIQPIHEIKVEDKNINKHHIDINKPSEIPHEKIKYNKSEEQSKPSIKASNKEETKPSIMHKKEEDKDTRISKEFISPPKAHVQKSDKIHLTQSLLLSNDYQIDSSVKKLDYKLPVKFKTPDYFRLIDTIKKEIDHAQRELNSNKIEKALNMTELALYYLNNIKV